MSSNDHAQGPQPSAREIGKKTPDLTAGGYLREERNRQGISLAEVAAATGIRAAVLRAIEDDDQDHLPAAVFVRGFLKLYAEHLGLEFNDLPACGGRQSEPATGPGTDPEINGPLPDILRLKREARKNRSFPPIYFLVLVLAVGLVGAAGYLGFTTLYDQDSPGQVPPAAVTAAAPEEPAPAVPGPAAAMAGDGATSPPPLSLATENAVPEPADFPFLVKIHFVEDVWLQVQIDDQPVREGLFRKGASREWRARDHLDFFFGNAGGVEMSLNGRALPGLGASGETIRISIPRDLPGRLSRDGT